MFYSVSLLSQKGPLALVWLVAHSAKKTGRREIASCDLTAAVSEVLEPSGGPIALRMAAHLVFGISVIYSRKTELLYKDSVSFFKDLGDARWRRASNVDLDDGGNKENSKQASKKGRGRGKKRGTDHLLPLDAQGAPSAGGLSQLLGANASAGDPTLLADLAAIEEEGQASFFFLDAAEVQVASASTGINGGRLARAEEDITLQNGDADFAGSGDLFGEPNADLLPDDGGALPEPEPYSGELGALDADMPEFEPDFGSGGGTGDDMGGGAPSAGTPSVGGARSADASKAVASEGGDGAATEEGASGEAGTTGQVANKRRKKRAPIIMIDEVTVLSTDTLKAWMADTDSITIQRPAKRVRPYNALEALSWPCTEGFAVGTCHPSLLRLFEEARQEGDRLAQVSLERVRRQFLPPKGKGGTKRKADGSPDGDGANLLASPEEGYMPDFGDGGGFDLDMADAGGPNGEDPLEAALNGTSPLSGADLEAERLRDAMATQQGAPSSKSGGTTRTGSSGQLLLDPAAAGQRPGTRSRSRSVGAAADSADFGSGGAGSVGGCGSPGGGSTPINWQTQNPTDCPISQYQLQEETAPQDGGSLTQTQLLESQALARRAMDAQAVNALAFLRSCAQRQGETAFSLDAITKLARGEPWRRRNTATKFFYRMLVLASNAYLRVDQAEPYGDVTMRPGVNFSASQVGPSPALPQPVAA